MNKNIILVIIVLALAALGLYLFNSSPKGTTSTVTHDYDFAMPDTAAITKIVIEDKVPTKVILTRKKGGWFVNDDFLARTDAIDVLLETFHHWAMKNYVSAEARPTVMKRMDVFGRHVEVYAGDQLLKSFTVGTETPDQLGSYVKLDDAKDPYAVYLPGFNGYLNSRFFTDASAWRKRTIWGFDNRNIKTIVVNYPGNTAESFRIDVTDTEAILKDISGSVIENFNVEAVNLYLAAFRKTTYEGAIVFTDGIYDKMDSVKNAGEIISIYVEPKRGESIEMKAYKINAKPDMTDSEGNLMLWDPDRLYGVINENTYVLVQNYGLQYVLKGMSDFKYASGLQ